MIDNQSLVYWRQFAPWVNSRQIEQDLVISRALIDMFNHPLLKSELAFRGGTALQKCFYETATRYSEDIDCVQITSNPIGPVFDALREVLEPWLGKPKVKQGHGRATLIYKFESTEPSNSKMSLKVEINTREHYNFLGLIGKSFYLDSPWYSGNCQIQTYQLDELLGTKLRALFQRKKGRDLFDMARAIELLPINLELILYCFYKYLEPMGLNISRAEYEENLLGKKNMQEFREDIKPLLSYSMSHDFDHDFNLVMDRIIVRLPGEAWKGVKSELNSMAIQ